MMEWETLQLTGEGPVRELVLNRPDVLNAINNKMLREIVDVAHYIDDQSEIRCVIVRGAGRSFSAGADLKEGITHEGNTTQMMNRAKLGARAIDTFSEINAITIAALHGHVIGGAACLAMACDFRIGAESASVSIRETKIGISLSWHSIPNVVHLVGPARAKEMIYFGDAYDAQTMLSYGFLGQVVKEKTLLSTAKELAEKVIDQPPIPLSMSKATINAVVKSLDRAICNLDEVGVTFTAKTHDASHAREALQTGEKPVWEHR